MQLIIQLATATPTPGRHPTIHVINKCLSKIDGTQPIRQLPIAWPAHFKTHSAYLVIDGDVACFDGIWIGLLFIILYCHVSSIMNGFSILSSTLKSVFDPVSKDTLSSNQIVIPSNIPRI